MSPKCKSVLLQILLALCLLSIGAALALLGVRPRCCERVPGQPAPLCAPADARSGP